MWVTTRSALAETPTLTARSTPESTLAKHAGRTALREARRVRIVFILFFWSSITTFGNRHYLVVLVRGAKNARIDWSRSKIRELVRDSGIC